MKDTNSTSRAASHYRKADALPDLPPVKLPRPSLGRCKSVWKALQQRQTTREIGTRKLPPQVLSNLLWAAAGINRTKVQIGTSGRTAASASNSQEIDLYVVMAQGTYLYDPARHRLVPVVAEDLRPLSLGPRQPDPSPEAPIRLVYVVDIDKLVHTSGFEEPGLRDPEIQKSYYYADTGLIAGNVYLFAAATGLATWFHNCDRAALAANLRLRRNQRVLFAQTVGYPVRK